MKRKTITLITLLHFAIAANTLAQQKLFTLLSPDSTGVKFSNEISDTKELNVISYEYYYNGGGIAIGDINNDGLPDLFFTSNTHDCKLYLNQGSMKFKDITKEAGVACGGINSYKTGVTMVDINNDGWMDIYVCRSVMVDPQSRKNILFINNKNGTFSDRATEYGVDNKGFSMQAYFNDMDGDGDLDLLVLNHPLSNAKTIHLTYNKKNVLEAVRDAPTPFESDRYYENVNGKYIDKTAEAGLMTRSFGLSAVLEDFNNDGKPDIYQANDYLEPDYLFINKGNGKFVNEFDKYFKHCSFSSMGTDYADINNDGLNDFFADDMLPEGNQRQKQLRRGNNYDEFEKMVKYKYGYQYVKNVLQINNGNNTYSDISYYTGTAYSDWSWAVMIADFDNDENKDLYIANGFMRDVTDMDFDKFAIDSVKKAMVKTNDANDILKLLSIIPSNKAQKSYFKNYGGLNLQKESKIAGLDQYAWSFGAAYADLDNDGDLDIVVNNTNDYAFVYRNNTKENNDGHSITLQLNGSAKNINGIGAQIQCVTPDGVKQSITSNPMKGYLSCRDNKILFGISKNQQADINITWPDGKKQELKNVTANQLLKINYADATTVTNKTLEPVAKLFTDVTDITKINFTYTDNEYIDFKLEPLLPHRFSQLGPCAAVGDFNGDKTDDLFIGGEKDKAATLFIQNADGTFSEKIQIAFNTDKMYEDGAASILDFDNDGDNDLLVTCGGNEYPNQDSKYPIRLYENDGKGNFTKKILFNNNFFVSANTIAISDYNKDGIKDIFIGGRVVPGHYGLTPNSYLFNIRNDSLIDITNNTSINKVGLVTAASWSDTDHDGWVDLHSSVCGAPDASA